MSMAKAHTPGQHMATEAAQGPAVFARTAAADHSAAIAPLALTGKRAIYTVARGSSDAAANILSYEMMRELGLPVTSLPPSVFSLGQGVDMTNAAALVVSQSGASDDLVRVAQGVRTRGGVTAAITNVAGSAVEQAADVTLPIDAGEEKAVPATKTVIGSIGAGMSLLSALVPGYAAKASASAKAIGALSSLTHPDAPAIQAALLRSRHVYVVGRDTSYGAAQEVALKLKECCALHAEAYSSSEVLHGPLQLATNPLMTIILDAETDWTTDSLNTAEARLRGEGGPVFRLCPSDIGVTDLTPAASAATLLMMAYPLILSTALALGLDPDSPASLAKVTVTR